MKDEELEKKLEDLEKDIDMKKNSLLDCEKSGEKFLRIVQQIKEIEELLKLRYENVSKAEKELEKIFTRLKTSLEEWKCVNKTVKKVAVVCIGVTIITFIIAITQIFDLNKNLKESQKKVNEIHSLYEELGRVSK